jgi:hypothetical protein
MSDEAFALIKNIKKIIKELDLEIDLLLKNKKENIGNGNQNGSNKK